MQEISSKYDPALTEDKWYEWWMQQRYFHSEPDHREAYTIVIPPPNVTGVLHMGHMLNNTIQDILIRRARMQGKNACWLPGTDHASIATEAKVVGKLREMGIDKASLSRDEFLKHAWDWKDKHGGIILEQLKKLGASCDWDRTRFTMDAALSESVIDVFIDLHKKGLIYRGVRMVNWDPKALTALSDEEVIFKEVNSKLYYLRYQVEGEADQWITIATTRPETILGDTAVCVHPEDERYLHLHGKRVLVPLIHRSVPIIVDEYVEREFGTGALKITPAHDINDYQLGNKYQLESIDIFNDNGTLNEKAQLYIGEDRFAVRDKIVVELQQKGNLVKTEEYMNKVGFSERTDAVIEPKLSMQWFCNMKEMAKPALDVVMSNQIQFFPEKFVNTYKHWMDNVKDWCISRQLWWGQRIPAWYFPDGSIHIAKTAEEAIQISGKTDIKAELIRQDDDVLDTWFSSWLWPISVFDGIRHPDNKDINYYYPTKVLITAPEILFFWVARMVMAGLEFRNEIPFKDVYLTGIVRDKLHRKMSKSLGNSPEPLDLIEKYGADGVRVGMLLSSPAGNDLLFDEGLCEQGRNFSNKIWNALRLIKGWQIDENIAQPEYAKVACEWISARIDENTLLIDEHFDKYRLSDALMAVYKLIWDEFCAWFLEMIKPPYGEAIDITTYNAAILTFEKLLKLLHPFMPFISEEIWHIIKDRPTGDDLIIAPWNTPVEYNAALLKRFEFTRDSVIAIRNIRAEKNIPFKESIELSIKGDCETADTYFNEVLIKLCNISSLHYVDEKLENALGFIVNSTEFYIPFGETIDIEAEIVKLKAELDYTRGFLQSVMKKMQNERFVQSAPAQVVEIERKKQQDAEARISVIEEQLRSFGA